MPQRLDRNGLCRGPECAIEFRWAAGQVDRLPELAADLLPRRVDVIVTPASTPAALAAKAATGTIPIVFAIGATLLHSVSSRASIGPDGNATGISFQSADLVGKDLDMLRELPCPVP